MDDSRFDSLARSLRRARDSRIAPAATTRIRCAPFQPVAISSRTVQRATSTAGAPVPAVSMIRPARTATTAVVRGATVTRARARRALPIPNALPMVSESASAIPRQGSVSAIGHSVDRTRIADRPLPQAPFVSLNSAAAAGSLDSTASGAVSRPSPCRCWSAGTTAPRVARMHRRERRRLGPCPASRSMVGLTPSTMGSPTASASS